MIEASFLKLCSLSMFQGQIGITLNHIPGIPKDPTKLSDIEAAETYNQFYVGWYAGPIFGEGDYPDAMKWQVGNKSLEQGYPRSRLPEFTYEEKIMLKGKLIYRPVKIVLYG